jgi:mannose-6-phosphate isomerase-like protein (cupin superfamily)
MTTEKSPLLTLSAGTGEVVWFWNSRMTIKATASTSHGQFGLVEALMPAGNAPPLHIHHLEDEIFWILEGHLTFRCGDETFPAAPGAYVHLPRGVPHTYVVEGDSNARYLLLYVPGGAENYFVDAGRPAEGDGLPRPGPMDIELMSRVNTKYQWEIVGPPMKPLSGSR